MTESFELAVISDVHIRDRDDAKIEKISSLFSWLEEKGCKKVLLNGDIFDVFIGNFYFQKYYYSFFQSLEQLSKSSQIIYLQGNHEFFLNKIPYQSYMKTALEDVYIHKSENHGNIYIAHGDHLNPSRGYQILRKILRNPITYFATKLLPGAMVRQICLGISDLSRHRNKNREKRLPHQKILSVIQEHSKNQNCSTAVIGHYHTPWAQNIKNQNIFGLDCWDRPNVLLFGEKHILRAHPDSKNTWQTSHPTPLHV
ncbi:MAG: UDP-2,3-diacylglucosamine diphosphatase [Oligoflexales bacterium]